jgi:deoxyinosine 3'endonuclease (endonuclease V)
MPLTINITIIAIIFKYLNALGDIVNAYYAPMYLMFREFKSMGRLMEKVIPNERNIVSDDSAGYDDKSDGSYIDDEV